MSRFTTARHAPGCACPGCLSSRARSIMRRRTVPGFRGVAAPPRPRAEGQVPSRFTWRPRLKWRADVGRYVLSIAYEDREFAKSHGFRWQPPVTPGERGYWWTDDERRALQLLEYADEDTRQRLRPHVVDNGALAASRATDAEIEIPVPPGLAYMPFQRAGIAYAILKAQSEGYHGILFGDDMGLGKTIQAIGAMNADPAPFPALVICPASLKINWRRELEKWLTHPTIPMIAGDWFPISADVVVINYERLQKHAKAIASKRWRTLIVDEAHYVKAPEAQRTQAVFSIEAERRYFLTGTPIPNRVMEAQTIFGALAPDVFGDRKKFKQRYGDARPETPRGRQRLAELQELARSLFLVRRRKSEVLTDLPPKVRQVIEFSSEGVEAVRAELRMVAAIEERTFAARVELELAKAGDDSEAYAAAVMKLQESVRVGLADISRLRHATALAKVPMVKAHVQDALDQGGKLLLFAHHHDVIEAYVSAFPKLAVKLTGEMETAARQIAVDRFQKDPSCRLFVGSIQAAGLGITLTAGSHVVFAELDWTPGNMVQAEDRAHRMTQRNSVLIQHLVLEGSIDARIAKALVAKQEVIDRALDARNEAEAEELKATPVVGAIGEGEHATAHVSRAQLERDAARVTPAMTAAVLQAVTYVPEDAHKVDRAVAEALIADGRWTPRKIALGRRIANRYRDALPEGLRRELARWPRE
ncbi:MAG TPA: DEAD/DEAH box helicase [Vicinamibacterales bacterium]|nr:DEAD/DEAH box helicase [Vicinamibacterales bacterium]